MSLLQEAEKLLAGMTRAEQGQLLNAAPEVVRDAIGSWLGADRQASGLTLVTIDAPRLELRHVNVDGTEVDRWERTE